MSPKKETSRRSSPRKSEDQKDDNLVSPSKRKSNEGISSSSGASSSGSGLKLRLKVKSNSEESVSASVSKETSANSNVTNSGSSGVKIIKLNFSRSNESVPESPTEPKKIGKRGRPKKDKSAVLAAAIAASQPNEIESEERRSRRRAAEEKIKRSVSSDVISSNNVVIVDEIKEQLDGERKKGRKSIDAGEGEEGGDRKRRRRRKVGVEDKDDTGSNGSKESIGSIRRSRSNEYVEITDNNNNQENSRTIVNPITLTTSFNPHETEFIQRSKTFLNISLQHDTFVYTSMLTNPLEVDAFKSTEDMVERLAAFHVGYGAGQYIPEELNNELFESRICKDEHLESFSALQDRYRQVVHSQSSKKVPTELLLLEQRLCLEEEKFLLVKMKNEYAARFLKPTTTASGTGSSVAGTSRSTTPSS